MYNRLANFLQENDILTDSQFGFRKGLSPKPAIMKLIDHILTAQGKGDFTISVFLDLRKAFDTIDHNIMLEKLNRYGIRNVSNNCFISYLTGREQYTCVNNVSSNIVIVTTGVSQGSTLGPLLFLLYISDIVTS